MVICGLFLLWIITFPKVGIIPKGEFINGVSSAVVIRLIYPIGVVGRSVEINLVPLSVPASQGCSILKVLLSSHLPVALSHRSTLKIPVNQSGDGAIIVMRDTKGKSFVTSTGRFMTCSVPCIGPGALNIFQAVFWVIMAIITSFSKVVIFPIQKEQVIQSISQPTNQWTNNRWTNQSIENRHLQWHLYRVAIRPLKSGSNLEMWVFEERGKPEYSEKNPSDQRREPTTNSTDILRRVRESIPSHIGGEGGECSNHCPHPCSQ